MVVLRVAAADLLLGARCPGCGCPALRLCRACGESIRPDPQPIRPEPVSHVVPGPGLVPRIAAGANVDVLRRTLLEWKEEGRFGLTGVVAHLLAASVAQLAPAGRPVVLVPVPTSRRSKRARGSDLVDELARAAAALLCTIGVDVRVRQALAYARSTADQAGLTASERAVNLDGAFQLRSARDLDVGDVVVIDDILTTGATVAEATRVLVAAGHGPVGVAVVAATPRRTGTAR